MTPRTLREAAQRPTQSSYLGARNWVSTGTHSGTWAEDDRGIALAIAGVIIFSVGILAALFFGGYGK